MEWLKFPCKQTISRVQMQFKLPVVIVLLNFAVSFQGELHIIYYLIGCFLFFNIHLFPPSLHFRNIYKSFPLKNYILLNTLNLKIEKYQRNNFRITQLAEIDCFGWQQKTYRILNSQKSLRSILTFVMGRRDTLKGETGLDLKPSPWFFVPWHLIHMDAHKLQMMVE